MKAMSYVAPLTLALGLTFTLNAHAQAPVPPTPCAVYLCMAGQTGVGLSGGPGCALSIAYWHAPAPAGLAIYTPKFNPPLTRTNRNRYLGRCSGASYASNSAIRSAIMATWGSVP